MLTVGFLSGEEDERQLELLGLKKLPSTSDFFMFEDGKVRAVMSLRPVLKDRAECHIDRIFFKADTEEDDKTFFLHVMMFKLREGSPVRIVCEGDAAALKPFGFVEDDGVLSVYSGDIDLFYNCGGKN